MTTTTSPQSPARNRKHTVIDVIANRYEVASRLAEARPGLRRGDNEPTAREFAVADAIMAIVEAAPDATIVRRPMHSKYEPGALHVRWNNGDRVFIDPQRGLARIFIQMGGNSDDRREKLIAAGLASVEMKRGPIGTDLGPNIPTSEANLAIITSGEGAKAIVETIG